MSQPRPRQPVAPLDPFGLRLGRCGRSVGGRRSTTWAGAMTTYLLIATLVSLAGLGSTGLFGMEAMVAATAETMLETGDYLVPELYGEIYTFKPPLVYWLAAGSIRLLGRSEGSIRLPAVLSTVLLGAVVLLLVGRVTGPGTGLFAALAAVTGALWTQQGSRGEFNAVVASLTGVAIVAACYSLVIRRSRASSWAWLLAYGALAGGFLAKGMPALMAFGPGLLGAAILTRQTHRLWSRGHLAGVGLFVSLIGAYLAVLWISAGPVAFEQPFDEARARGFEWTLQSLGRTFAKPLVIAGAFLPWSLAWPWAVAESSPRAAAEEGALRRLRRAAWAFLGFGVLAFMVVPTHETRYYLPLSVPAAIVSSLGLERLAEPSRLASRIFHGVGLLFGTAAIGLVLASELDAGARSLLAVSGVAVIAVVHLLHQRRPRRYIACTMLAAALCGSAVESWVLRPHRARFRVLEAAAGTLDRVLPEAATVWALGEADIVGKNASLFYYLDRPVRTFSVEGSLPAPGSYVVLTGRKLRELERASPGRAARLELVRRLHHPWRLFLLYRVRAA